MAKDSKVTQRWTLCGGARILQRSIYNLGDSMAQYPWQKAYKHYSDFCNAMAEDMSTDSSMPPETHDIKGMAYQLARVLEKYLPRWGDQIKFWLTKQFPTPAEAFETFGGVVKSADQVVVSGTDLRGGNQCRATFQGTPVEKRTFWDVIKQLVAVGGIIIQESQVSEFDFASSATDERIINAQYNVIENLNNQVQRMIDTCRDSDTKVQAFYRACQKANITVKTEPNGQIILTKV